MHGNIHHVSTGVCEGEAHLYLVASGLHIESQWGWFVPDTALKIEAKLLWKTGSE